MGLLGIPPAASLRLIIRPRQRRSPRSLPRAPLAGVRNGPSGPRIDRGRFARVQSRQRVSSEGGGIPARTRLRVRRVRIPRVPPPARRSYGNRSFLKNGPSTAGPGQACQRNLGLPLSPTLILKSGPVHAGGSGDSNPDPPRKDAGRGVASERDVMRLPYANPGSSHHPAIAGITGRPRRSPRIRF